MMNKKDRKDKFNATLYEVLFNREVSLEALLEGYSKDELKDLAKLHQIKGYSKYKKSEFVRFMKNKPELFIQYLLTVFCTA
jgi:hypothetical protein